MKKLLFTLVLGLNSLSVSAEEIKTYKGTDIYLFDLDLKSNNVLSNGKNITQREGYDNQPYFTPDNKSILYTSIRDKQSDIYKYDIDTNIISQVTYTNESSEYSANIIPNTENMSMVMVEKDGIQRLWQMSKDGYLKPIIEDIMPIGYYAWANDKNISLFVLGEHNNLHILNKYTGKHNIVKSDIGRSIHKIPNQNAYSFVHKVNDKNFFIKSIDIDNFYENEIVKTLDGSEDYAWTSDSRIIMGNKSSLYIFNPKKDKKWSKIFELSNMGIKKILRIAISPNGKKIALVSEIPD